MKTRTGAGLCLLLLCGCSTYPLIPSWSAAEIDKAGIAGDPYLAATPEQALTRIRGIRELLARETDSRRIKEIIASEVTFYGTFLGALGVSLDKLGLRNTGAGAATLSTIFAGRYRLADQQQAFRKAEARAACLESTLTVALLDPNETQTIDTAFVMTPRSRNTSGNQVQFNAIDVSDGIELRSNAYRSNTDIPLLVWRSLRRLTNDLRISLAGLNLTPMTRDQIKHVLDEAQAKEDEAKKQAGAVTNALGATTQQQIHLLNKLVAAASIESTLETCFVSNPQ